jgi:hypothetical protein
MATSTQHESFHRGDIMRPLSLLYCSCVMLGLCAGFASGQGGRVVPSSPHSQTSLNVRDFGAVGDGMHDDAPAILAAVTHAINGNIRIVEFPPTTAEYLIGTPLVLPSHPGGWIKLNLDGPLSLQATLTLGAFYLVYGNNPDSQQQFAQGPEVTIFVPPQVNPAIHVIGNDVKLENLDLYFVGGTGGGDGILIDTVAVITAENVSMNSGRTGANVHIIGDGFTYLFEKGVYINESGPNFVIDGSPQCATTGYLTMRDVTLAGQGIQLNVACGVAINYAFENILYEAYKDSFLTINGAGPSINTAVFGLYFKNIQLSDPVGTPAPPLITNNNLWTSGIQIFNCWAFSSEVTGDTINDLEIWSGVVVPVGQATNYVFHGPTGVVSTMPTEATASSLAPTAPIRPPSVKEFLAKPPQ